MEIKKENVKKILIIKTGAVGDIVRTFPALISVAKIFPNATISFLTGKQYIELIEPCPYISEIIPYDIKALAGDHFGFLRLAMELRAKHFDLVLNFQNNRRFDLLAHISGAQYHSDIVKLDRPINGVEGIFKILETIGLHPKKRHYEFWFTQEDHDFAKKFRNREGLKNADKLVGLCPGGGWKSKQWSEKNYADLAGKLAEVTGGRIIVFGSPDEVHRAKAISDMAPVPVIIASGETTLRQAARLISDCSVFVGNDSGLMHIAAICGVPTVGIFGSTNPSYHRPCGVGNLAIFKGVECSPCHNPECRLEMDRYFCLSSVPMDEVFQAANKIAE